MQYIGLNEEYDEAKCDTIFAFLYKIKYTDTFRGIYEDDIQNDNDAYFVNLTNKENDHTVAKKYLEIDHNNYRLLPLLRKNVINSNDKQRDVMVIFGSSGSGKSFITDKIVRSFKSINQQPVYYISSKNMLRDPSFDINLYEEFIPFNKFLQKFDNDKKLQSFTTGDLYDNSLLVIDDVMLSDKAQKKLFWAVMDVILKLKRMNNISLIYIVHEITDFTYTRDLFTEMTMYLSFTNDLRNRNNRVLDTYLKLTKDEQQYIGNVKNSRWTCVYCKRKLILTESSIRLLK